MPRVPNRLMRACSKPFNKAANCRAAAVGNACNAATRGGVLST